MPSSGATASRFNRASLVDFSLALSALQRRWVPGEERDVVERILCDPLGHSPCLGGICADHQDSGVMVVHRQAPVVLRLLHVGKSKPTRAWNGRRPAGIEQHNGPVMLEVITQRFQFDLLDTSKR